MISLKAEYRTAKSLQAEILAIFVFQDIATFQRQIKELKDSYPSVATSFKSSTFAGKSGETLLLFPSDSKVKKLLLVGLGKANSLTLEHLRRAAATASQEGNRLRATTLSLLEPDHEAFTLHDELADGPVYHVTCGLSEGAALALYRFDKYISSRDNRITVKEVRLITLHKKRLVHARQGVRRASIVCNGTILARDLQNAPGNEIYPESLAAIARRTGKDAGFRVRIFNESQIRRLRMGGLLGVSMGSSKPPRFVVMEHNRASRSRATVVLVGKGVTFDAGGISIKPAANMAEMKMDMSGAAAVIGTMQAAARLKLPLHVVGLVPATENLLGGSALKPGDILRHHNGKTSEIDNTDAEGRLILADALSYASKFKPDLVIDLATLTGACVVALGHVATGMMGNDQTYMDRLTQSGSRTYERVWQLPLFEEYERLIRSDVADVKNVGGRWGGAITAALFLKKFIGEYPWIHLDIAGTAITEESFHYIPKGGSGVGVRLLIDFLSQWNKTARNNG